MKLPVPLLVLVAAMVFRANCREPTDGTDRLVASPEEYLGGLLNPDFSGEDHYLSNGLEGIDYFEDTPLNVGINEQLKKDVTEKNQIELRGNSGKGSIKKLIKNLESMERRLTQANQQLKMELQAIKEHQSNVTNMNTEFKSDLQSIKEHQLNVTNMNTEFKSDLQSIKEHQANFTNMNTEIKTDLQSINLDITDIKEHQANMTNVNTELKTDLQSIQINLTDSNSELKGEFNMLKDNITGYNVNNDVKLDSIRTSLTSIGAVITNHTAILESIKRLQGCPSGYIRSSLQCFKILTDEKNLSWFDAKSKCADKGLSIAKPIDPVAVRNILWKIVGNSHIWIGARGAGSSVKWDRDDVTISNSSPLWRRGEPGTRTSTGYCLWLQTYDNYIKDQPNQPYRMFTCTHTGATYALCELV